MSNSELIIVLLYSHIVAASLQRDGSKICMRIGSQPVSIDFSTPITILLEIFNCKSASFIYVLTDHSETTRTEGAVCKVRTSALQLVLVNLGIT